MQYAEARRKLRPKSENLQGKETALTHTNGHTGRASTVPGLGWLRCPADLSDDGSKGRAPGTEEGALSGLKMPMKNGRAEE